MTSIIKAKNINIFINHIPTNIYQRGSILYFNYDIDSNTLNEHKIKLRLLYIYMLFVRKKYRGKDKRSIERGFGKTKNLIYILNKRIKIIFTINNQESDDNK